MTSMAMNTVLMALQDPVTLILVPMSLALLAYILLSKKKTSRYPDGPSTIPILGNLHQLLMSKDMNIIHFLEDNRRKYGNVYTIELGGVKRVVICGYDNMQDLLVKKADFTSLRKTDSMPAAYTAVADVTPGLFWAKYPHWKTVRSFALNILRSEGMGKSSLELPIMHEVHSYIDHFITPNLNQPINVSRSIMFATANVVSGMILGNRREYDDPKFHMWMKAFGDCISAATKAAIARNIPFASYLPGDIAGIQTDLNGAKFIRPNAAKAVAERKAILDPNNPTTYIDRFLIYAAKEEEKGITDSVFTDENAGITMMHLYAAGTETTSTALQWILLYMCAFPEIQSKVHDEIDKELGSNEVRFQDRLILPYTEAVLLETLRLANIVPTALPHTLEKDTVIEGKAIPAGTELMLNMASVLWDDTIFEEPNTFKPERYLTGDVATKKAKSLVFGIGRRSCLGESLAKMELSLFFTTFMQKFNVCLPAGAKPCLEGKCTLVNAPANCELIFNTR